MVQQVEAQAIKVSNGNDDWEYYRCNKCHDMFSTMVHFEGWDFYYCIPRRCPNCGRKFKNGMKEV